MKTTKILPIAIIAALPFTANSANIQGAMYTAPAGETNLTPAPTTNADAPYGRINIDTDDQEHIATTAYVKGAYNSAIAAVNKLDAYKQNALGNNTVGGAMSGSVMGSEDLLYYLMLDDTQDENLEYDLVSVAAVIDGIRNQRVEIWTTWDDDSAKTDVAFKTVVPED